MIQYSEQVLDEIVQFLEEHEEALRIKKLIFCISKKQWENDINILNQVSLKSLIKELLNVKPNRYQLTFSVYKVIKILNRPAAYEAVANLVIEKIAQLYNAPREVEVEETVNTMALSGSALVPQENNSSEPDKILEQIAGNLETNREEVRIKKLIFAACKNRWENDIHVIDQYEFKKLILELRNTYGTPEDLRRVFTKISENLNKPSLYAAISNVIVEQLLTLYQQATQIEAVTAKNPKTQIFNTQIIQVNNSYNLKQAKAEDFETSVVDLSNVSQAYPTQETAQVLPMSLESGLVKVDSKVFDLKAEIMQYTNPLRVKILLFSILEHPWEQSDQDWAMIRTYTLNDLLQQLLNSKKSLKQIDNELQMSAKSLPASEDNLQCANTVVEVLKRFL